VLIITYQVMLKLNKNTSPLPRQALDEVASRVKGSGEVTCICPECLKDRNVCVCEILPTRVSVSERMTEGRNSGRTHRSGGQE